MIAFANRVAHLVRVDRELAEVNGVPTATYTVEGELFFASSNDLYTMFDYAEDPARVVIDLTRSHLWDASTIAALDSVTTKYEERGTEVTVVGLNAASRRMRETMSGMLNT